jgi:cytochrome c553
MNVAGASSVALGGTVNTLPSGGTQAGTTAATPFDWGATVFDASAGNAILYQDHMNGMGCINAACHGATTFAANASGTVYQADGTTYASNVQIGVFIDGALGTTYAGTMGNFYVTLPSATNWATAQIALRTATGSVAMPVNTAATGNCNSCHDATNRIVTP